MNLNDLPALLENRTDLEKLEQDLAAVDAVLPEMQLSNEILELVRKARRELDTDAGARDMVKDFLRKQMEMQIEVMSGKADVKAKQDSLQKLGELLSLNSRARDYISAYFRFQQVMQDIYKMIGDAVGEGMDPFAEK